MSNRVVCNFPALVALMCFGSVSIASPSPALSDTQFRTNAGASEAGRAAGEFAIRDGSTPGSGEPDGPVGILEITTVPNDAEVWLDGVKMGITPLVLHQWPVGECHLRLLLDEYVTVEQDVRVTEGERTRIHSVLVPDWGSLAIDSEPAGAAVILDEVPTDHTTSCQLDRIRSGKRSIRLSLHGYEDASGEVVVVRGMESRLALRLVQQRASLSVTSAYEDGTPCKGDLSIDGKPHGKTPWVGLVAVGQRDVVVSCAGGNGQGALLTKHGEKASLGIQVVGLPTEKERGRVNGRKPRGTRGAVLRGTASSDGAAGAMEEDHAEGDSLVYSVGGSVELDDRPVRIPVSLSASSGIVLYDGRVMRTHVGMGLDAGLRFRALTWMVPTLGVWWTVESPQNVTLRPGVQWYFGSFPLFVRTAVVAMVHPGRKVGLHAGIGGDIPLWKGGFLEVEAATTVWSARVTPVDLRLGIGHVF